MNAEQFLKSLASDGPAAGLSVPLQALWWDAKGSWDQAHSLVDELETKDGMAVHAYLHRKEGAQSNADYWYRLSDSSFSRLSVEAEWTALLDALLTGPFSN